MGKQLIRHREHAFQRQSGQCFYCRCQMWNGKDSKGFCERYSLTPGQARALRCTAEHIVAKCDGGKDNAENIAAACERCNYGRHARKKPKTPSEFAAHVGRRIRALRWHSFDVRSRGLLMPGASQVT